MCGRYTLAAPDPAAVRARFPIGETVEVRQRFNIAPGDDVLAVITDRQGAPRGELLRWGLVPRWSDAPVSPVELINARAETLAERPAFREALGRFRCLIPADGFYEWSFAVTAGAGAPARPAKRAFHITHGQGDPFAFAGLWSVWRRGDTELRSCTIITTAANAVLAPLHDRMPVILEAGVETAWLDPGTPPELLAELLRAPDAEQTVIRPVGPAVNDARYDGPECLAEPVPGGEPEVSPPSPVQGELF